ncbi:MAG TPA: PLDc N-terminal domain-containing protein [Blastocatellia bacterium]|nr:PLDc N-terminal domain-containing protein [Blastocatellia bacterium]
MKSNMIWIALGLGILGMAVVAYSVLNVGRNRQTILTYSQLNDRIGSKGVKRAEIGANRVTGQLSNGEEFRTGLSNTGAQAQIAEELRSSGAEVSFVSSGNAGWLAGLTRDSGAALLLFALILLPAFWIWMIIDCAVKEPPGPDKIVWILIILLGNAIGAAIYFVVRRGRRGHGPISAAS